MQKPNYKQTLEMFETVSQDREVILFGRSPLAKDAIQKFGRVKYLCDNNYELWGEAVLGVEICSPLRLYSENPDKVVILVTAGADYVYAITKQIQDMDQFDIFYYNVIENEFLCEISEELFDNYKKIKEVELLLSDHRSMRILREIVHRRMIGSNAEYGDLTITGEQQYLFPPMYKKINECEIILDCGAYTGDTVEKFVRFFGNRVRKIYSFEALPQNLVKLREIKEELKHSPTEWNGELAVLPFAVSDQTSTITFCETSLPGGSFSPDFRNATKFKYVEPVQTLEVEARSIDETIPAVEKVTLIKMDIEGAEYEALLGAERTVKTHRPRLAISIYHNACDYWRIAQLVKQFVPEYRIAIRHHKARHVDTVLYAWAE